MAQNHAEAARWFRRAAEQGETLGQFNPGLVYRKGHGVARDLAGARRWLDRAAANFPPGEDREKAILARNQTDELLKSARPGLAKSENKHEQLLCNASLKEKSGGGYQARLMVAVLRDMNLGKANLPSHFQAPVRKPTVNAGESPEDDGLCARVVFELNGTNVSGKVEYAVYNMVADAERRTTQANASRFDRRILGEEFHGVAVGNSWAWAGEEKDKAVARCWYPAREEPEKPLRVVCMDLKPLSGIVTIARDDFPPPSQRATALEQMIDVQMAASKILVKALAESYAQITPELFSEDRKGSAQSAHPKEADR